MTFSEYMNFKLCFLFDKRKIYQNDMSVENRFPTTYLSSEKLIHNVQFRVINISEYGYHANRLPIYDLDTPFYASNTKQVHNYVVTVWQ